MTKEEAYLTTLRACLDAIMPVEKGLFSLQFSDGVEANVRWDGEACRGTFRVVRFAREADRLVVMDIVEQEVFLPTFPELDAQYLEDFWRGWALVLAALMEACSQVDEDRLLWYPHDLLTSKVFDVLKRKRRAASAEEFAEALAKKSRLGHLFPAG